MARSLVFMNYPLRHHPINDRNSLAVSSYDTTMEAMARRSGEAGRVENIVALTGKFEFRKTFWGKVMLRVEEDVKPFWQSKPRRRWRDAMLMDLAAPEMRHLIDMGRKTWLRPAAPLKPPPASEQPEVSTPADVVAESAPQNDQMRTTH